MTGVVIGLIAAALLICWAAFSPAAQERQRADAKKQAQIMCAHCRTRGRVTRTTVTKKRGISGGKATGALLTGGVSMLGTGLSRKETVTRLKCGHCGTTWDV